MCPRFNIYYGNQTYERLCIAASKMLTFRVIKQYDDSGGKKAPKIYNFISSGQSGLPTEYSSSPWQFQVVYGPQLMYTLESGPAGYIMFTLIFVHCAPHLKHFLNHIFFTKRITRDFSSFTINDLQCHGFETK